MNTISILPESDDESPASFRAFTKDLGATGRTPGEALDALTLLIGAGETGAAVLVQPFLPDAHFSAEQRERLSTLMERWRAARAAGDSLPATDEAELEKLIDAELEAATARAAQMARHLEATRMPHPLTPEEAYAAKKRFSGVRDKFEWIPVGLATAAGAVLSWLIHVAVFPALAPPVKFEYFITATSIFILLVLMSRLYIIDRRIKRGRRATLEELHDLLKDPAEDGRERGRQTRD